MSTHVYRLHVTYPPGSDAPGWAPPAWTADLREEPDTGAVVEVPFSWPAAHDYLSQSGANERAALLRIYGAEVVVKRSLPVQWPGEEQPDAD